MKESVTVKNACIIAFMFYISNAYMWGRIHVGGRDSWLFVLIGMLIYCVVMIIYAAVCRNDPGKDIFELYHGSFNKFFAKLFSIFYIIYGLAITFAATMYYTDFIATNILQRTPRALILGMICLTCIIMACAGRSSVGWWASFFLIPIVFFCIFDIVFSSGNINLENLFPILYDKTVVKDGIATSLVFPLGEIILLFSVYGGVAKRRQNYLMWVIPWICANVLIAVVYARNTAVLGDPLNNSLAFSTYFVQSVASVSKELQRVEVMISVIIWFANIVCGAVALMFVSQGVRLFTKKYADKYIIIASGVLIFLIAVFMPHSADDIIKIVDKYKYYLIALQIAGPAAVFAVQNARKSRSAANKTEN